MFKNYLECDRGPGWPLRLRLRLRNGDRSTVACNLVRQMFAPAPFYVKAIIVSDQTPHEEYFRQSGPV